MVVEVLDVIALSVTIDVGVQVGAVNLVVNPGQSVVCDIDIAPCRIADLNITVMDAPSVVVDCVDILAIIAVYAGYSVVSNIHIATGRVTNLDVTETDASSIVLIDSTGSVAVVAIDVGYPMACNVHIAAGCVAYLDVPI